MGNQNAKEDSGKKCIELTNNRLYGLKVLGHNLPKKTPSLS